MDYDFDIIIVGGGSAGITAGIYAVRSGRKVAIIEKMMLGGQLNMIDRIDNYTGCPSIDGMTLSENMARQIKDFNIPVIYDDALEYKLSGDIKEVICKKKTYRSLAVIIATGSYTRELEIEGERDYKGRGVSYCATCDGHFFKGKKVAVVGSGNYAKSDAIYLSNLCEKVYVLSRDESFDMPQRDNVEIFSGVSAKKIEGDDVLQKCIIMQNGEEKSLSVDGVFVAIGRRPNTSLLQEKLKLNEQGYIVCDELMMTSVEGIFACGDVRDGTLKQVSTAVGDGAIAGTQASKYCLKELFTPREKK